MSVAFVAAERSWGWRIAAGLGVMLAASSAQALEFRANGGISMTTSGVFSPIDSYDISGFFQAAGGVTYDDAPGPPSRSLHAQANSSADVVGLRAHAFAQVLKNDPQGGAFNSRLNAGSAWLPPFPGIR